MNSPMKSGRISRVLLAVLALGIAVAAFAVFQSQSGRREALALMEDEQRAHEAQDPARKRAADALEAPLAHEASERSENPLVEPRTQVDAEQLEVRIVDPANAPIAAGKLVLFRDGALLAQAVTGDDGKARFPGLEGRAEYVIAAPGWDLARGEIELRPGEQTIALVELATVAGSVLVDGAPPSEAFDLQWTPNARFGDRELPPAVAKALVPPKLGRKAATTRVHANGTFQFRGVRPESSGSLSWTACYFLADTENENVARSLSLEAPRRDVLLELTEGCELRLRVVDPEGAPVPSASVTLRREVKQESGFRMSTGGGSADGEGRFSKALLPDAAETFAVTVAAPNSSAAQTHELTRPALLRGVWDVGDLATVATRTISVLVQDTEGNPLTEAEAYAWPSGNFRKRNKKYHEARIPVAIAADSTAVAVEKFGYASTIVDVARDASEVTATLQRTCVLEFELIGFTGDSPGLSLELHGPFPMFSDEEPDLRPGEPRKWPQTPRVEGGSFGSSTSNDETTITVGATKDGRWRVAGLVLGQSFQARLTGGGKTLCEVETPPLGPGERRTLPLEIRETGKSLRVRVTSPAGEAVLGATIYVLDGGRHKGVVNLTVDEQGELELKSLYGDRCTFVVSSKLFAPKRVHLRPIPEGRFDVVLEAGRSIEAELVNPDGSAFDGKVEFAASIGAPGHLRKTRLGPGRYRVDGLPSGDVSIQLDLQSETIERLQRAGNAHLRVVVGEIGSIQVKVQGTPSSEDGVWMVAAAAQGASQEFTRVALHALKDETRWAFISNLGAGSYEVWLVRCSDPANDDWVRVGAPQSVVIDAEHRSSVIEMVLPR